MPARRSKKAAPRRRKPAARRDDLRPLHQEVPLYLGRKSTLVVALSIGHGLRVRVPRGVGAQAEKAFARMLACCKRVELYLGRTPPPPAIDLGVRRNALVAAIGRARRVLAALARAPASEQTTQARIARDALCGRQGPPLLRESPRVLWDSFGAILEHHQARPTMMRRLESLVTPGLVAEVIEAHEALGAALTARDTARRAPVVDVRAFTAQLNGLIDHYALCVFATAAPGDDEAMRTALHLLEPIRVERTDRSRELRRKRRRAKAPGKPEASSPLAVRPTRARKA